MIVESISCDVVKTKTIFAMLEALTVSGKRNLLIIDKDTKNVFLSGRNIRDLEIRPVSEINALDILRNENIIFGDERLIAKVQEAVAI
jgi:large subunit ribosomal protein L4